MDKFKKLYKKLLVGCAVSASIFTSMSMAQSVNVNQHQNVAVSCEYVGKKFDIKNIQMAKDETAFEAIQKLAQKLHTNHLENLELSSKVFHDEKGYYVCTMAKKIAKSLDNAINNERNIDLDW